MLEFLKGINDVLAPINFILLLLVLRKINKKK